MTALGIGCTSNESETWFDQRPTHGNRPRELVNAQYQADALYHQLGRISDEYVEGKATMEQLNEAMCKSLQADLDYQQLCDRYNQGLL